MTEDGRLCQGAGAHEGGDRRWRVFITLRTFIGAAKKVLLMLLVLVFVPAFVEPRFWKEGSTLLICLGVILVPGTFLVASYVGRRTWALSVPAAAYNGAAAWLLARHVGSINVAKAHPVALAINEQMLSAAIAILAVLNVWSLVWPSEERDDAGADRGDHICPRCAVPYDYRADAPLSRCSTCGAELPRRGAR